MSTLDKKRKRNELIDTKDYKYIVKDNLNCNGFFHFTNTLNITDQTYQELIDISDKKSDVIFNHNEISKSNDFTPFYI